MFDRTLNRSLELVICMLSFLPGILQAKLQLRYNEMSFLKMLIILNILAVINIEGS